MRFQDFLTHVQGVLRRTGGPLVLALLVLAGCSSTDPGFPSPQSNATSGGLGGTVIIDNDDDGLVSTDDSSVAGAKVTALRALDPGQDQAPLFADDPNTAPTTTADNGSFVLNYRSQPQVAGVRVSVQVPLDDGESAGSLSWIVPLQAGDFQNVVALPQLPQHCTDDTSDCGTFLPPDLAPIISWDQVDPQARSLLEPDGSDERANGFLPPETWFIETDDTGRRLLRFASVTANIGAGPLNIISAGVAGDGDGTADTWQRIWSDTWHYRDLRSGEFLFHEGHDHIHFDAFERYRLLDADGAIVAESSKVSFCLRDSLRVSDETRPTTGIFGPAADCGAVEQAINPGFGDHYNQFLPDQWIDISGIAPGAYTVEITADPLEVIEEADETNNTGTFNVVIN